MKNTVAERCARSISLTICRPLRGELLAPDRRLADRKDRVLGCRAAGIEYNERPDQDARSECADHGRLKGKLHANAKSSCGLDTWFQPGCAKGEGLQATSVTQ